MQKKKQIAIKLRQQAMSINDISKELGIAKSTCSIWVRDVELTGNQIDKLKSNSHTRAAIEKRRESRLKNEAQKRNQRIKIAQNSVGTINDRELFLIGVMLYWAEGGKTQRMVRFSNGDPEMIKIMMSFFTVICDVPESKFRGYIHIHPNLSVENSEKYWSEISGIPRKQFFKTYNKKNISSKNTRNSLPYGVFDIYIMDTSLFDTIVGWAKGIFSGYNPSKT